LAIGVSADGSMLLELKGRDGSRIRQEYHPPPGFQPILSGEPSRARNLVRGQEIRLYLPSDRWHVIESDGGPDRIGRCHRMSGTFDETLLSELSARLYHSRVMAAGARGSPANECVLPIWQIRAR
jgi:hypothetical protein